MHENAYKSNPVWTFWFDFSSTPANAFAIRVGSSQQNGGKLIGVKRIINHEKFNMIFPDYDFTLLELAEPLTFTDSIQPIALADADLKIDDGTTCLISGWGIYFLPIF